MGCGALWGEVCLVYLVCLVGLVRGGGNGGLSRLFGPSGAAEWERRDGRETARLATTHFDLVGRNRLSGHTGIQDRWIQVGSVRPIDRP